ncbi:MAG: GNAT family N-acetyltransferase [Bacteroidetes bacterium]|nr:GNAT family N-acetyltransferase [Bacteroidota bacterium]
MNKELLLQHRIEFLSTHRGSKKSVDGIEYIDSDDARYKLAFPSSLEKCYEVPDEFKICLPDWVTADLNLPHRKLLRSITFMTLKVYIPGPHTNKDIVVKIASSAEELEDFTIAQTEGFYGSSPEYQKKLEWLRKKNLMNFKNPNHLYLTAYYNDKPTGAALSIIYENIIGINMLATIPEFREKGISTKIIKFVSDYAKENKIPTVTLQVDTDSYAHSFYLHHGFENIFKCREYIYEI